MKSDSSDDWIEQTGSSDVQFSFLRHLLLDIWEIEVGWGKGFITCFLAQLKALGERGLISDTHEACTQRQL